MGPVHHLLGGRLRRRDSGDPRDEALHHLPSWLTPEEQGTCWVMISRKNGEGRSEHWELGGGGHLLFPNAEVTYWEGDRCPPCTGAPNRRAVIG